MAINMNKLAKLLATNTPQSGFSHQTNTKAHTTSNAESVYNKTLTPFIVVNI